MKILIIFNDSDGFQGLTWWRYGGAHLPSTPLPLPLHEGKPLKILTKHPKGHTWGSYARGVIINSTCHH